MPSSLHMPKVYPVRAQLSSPWENGFSRGCYPITHQKGALPQPSDRSSAYVHLCPEKSFPSGFADAQHRAFGVDGPFLHHAVGRAPGEGEGQNGGLDGLALLPDDVLQSVGAGVGDVDAVGDLEVPPLCAWFAAWKSVPGRSLLDQLFREVGIQHHGDFSLGLADEPGFWVTWISTSSSASSTSVPSTVSRSGNRAKHPLPQPRQPSDSAAPILPS